MDDSVLIHFGKVGFLIGMGLLIILLPVVWWRRRNLSYLLFFSIFWVYLLFVVKIVIFPVAINTNYGGPRIMPRINLVPFYVSYCSILVNCVIGILGNIVLTLPFGFGINFLVRVKRGNFLWLAISVGLVFELSQLLLSVTFNNNFRSVSINDVLLNATGVLLGYALFRVFAWAYLKLTKYFSIKPKGLFADIYDVVSSSGP